MDTKWSVKEAGVGHLVPFEFLLQVSHALEVQLGSYSLVSFVIEAPPVAPSGVMKNIVESQFTASTTSINLTWSASSEADNYIIMVAPTPLLLYFCIGVPPE